MSEWQTAILCLLTVGGAGLSLILLGLLFLICQKKKIKNCTNIVNGYVIRYCFRGEGHMFPIIEYQVDDRIYTVPRRYRGYITIRKVSTKKIYEDRGIHVTPNDYLYVPMSAISNLRAMAEHLWPMGSEMKVYYNPNHPKEAIAEKIPEKAPIVTPIFTWTGIGMILLSFLIAFLIMN